MALFPWLSTVLHRVFIVYKIIQSEDGIVFLLFLIAMIMILFIAMIMILFSSA